MAQAPIYVIKKTRKLDNVLRCGHCDWSNKLEDLIGVLDEVFICMNCEILLDYIKLCGCKLERIRARPDPEAVKVWLKKMAPKTAPLVGQIS